MPFWESQESLTAFQWIARALVMYLYLLFLTKLMGQREIGQLTLFDFIIAITIGSILASSLSTSTNDLIGPIITLLVLSGLQIIISVIILKQSKLRKILEEEPIILIQNGQFLENAMRKTRVNLNDLTSMLRQKGYSNPSQVEFAVLEPNGKLSVIPKSQNRPVSPADLGLATNYEGYPVFVIEDGNIINDNLERNNLDEKWLLEQLKNYNISSPKDVLAALLDTQGNLFLSLKNNKSEQTSN